MAAQALAQPLHVLSATEALRKIYAKEISVRDYVTALLDHAARVEPSVKAWVVLDRARALARADELDAQLRDGTRAPGKIFGMPVGVKDVFNTTDFKTARGCAIWKDYTPGNDARVVFMIRQEDGIVPGKTVTAELSVHTPGPTVNPHNFAYGTGTSSSGSAAAVASFMVPFAIGTQTAGSTIRPASYCGVYGFKPSFGLLPRTAMLKTTDTLDHVGLFARTIADLDLFFDVMRVQGSDYPLANVLVNEQRNSNAKWRVALIKSPKWDLWEPYAQKALLDFAGKIGESKNITVTETELPADFAKIHEIHEKIYCKALSYYFAEEYGRNKDKLSPLFCDMIVRGQKITAQEYQQALDEQARISSQLNDFFKNYDIILTLSTGGEALKGPFTNDRPDTCLMWTFCGAPAITLPVFTGPNGLPFGAQIVSRRKTDKDLIAFAKLLESEGALPKVEMPAPLRNL